MLKHGYQPSRDAATTNGLRHSAADVTLPINPLPNTPSSSPSSPPSLTAPSLPSTHSRFLRPIVHTFNSILIKRYSSSLLVPGEY